MRLTVRNVVVFEAERRWLQCQRTEILFKKDHLALDGRELGQTSRNCYRHRELA
ncbi:hypothetical protein DPMN_042511 [Dreissena polymorpha]|uniref:Uncharacterized protein n=1 Tax=Dreissena polymorpha TaxID=45954 RepID=A0A9D4D0X3_DREPO|nr:hypothetical protein DPMN_042511 [Dreissena polymorpha]